jgi:two-component system response regulator
LLDLKLPYVPGLEVLKWIRSQPILQSHVVVVLTSSDLESDRDRAYRLGANSYLVKTSSSEDLIKMVKLIHHYWLKLNRPPPESP